MSQSACLIFNPTAGKGDPVEELVAIRKILEPRINLDIRPTSKEVGPAQLAQAAVKRGARTIIAAGGDGTTSDAAEAVVNTGIPLGIIPLGTANAFTTALGIPNDIQGACETILAGATRTVDAAECNGKPMILLAGVGFEAETVELADRTKNILGQLSYFLAGVGQLKDLETFETYLEIEDRGINLQAAAVTIANAAPPTSVLAHGPAEIIVDDGLLDITIVSPANKTDALFAAYHLFRTGLTRTAANRDDISYLRAKHVKIRTEPPQPVVLDGDSFGTTPIEIKCIPGGLTILVPN